MIKNYNCFFNNCCMSKSNDNFEGSVKITNNVQSLQLVFTLQYMYGDRLITKSTPVFGCGCFERIPYPKKSSSVQLDIYRHTNTGNGLLYDVVLKNEGAVTYEVVGTVSHPILRRIY